MFNFKNKTDKSVKKTKKKRVCKEKIEEALEEVKQLSIEAENFFDSLEKQYSSGEDEKDGNK